MTQKIFEVFQSGSSGLWYFHLKAANGEIISASEGYHNKSDILDLYNTYFATWDWVERDGGDSDS